ncbi:MAG: PqiC family protein [Pseudomonadota bacterium]
MMRSLSALLLILSLAACGSTPPTQVFTLSAAEEPDFAAVVDSGPLIYIDQAAVAEYVDRTQMVTRSGDYGLSLHEFAVWSEPLGRLITRSLVDDLSLRYGADRVRQTPVPLYRYPDWRIELQVQRFDVDESGAAVIDARWTLLQGRDERLTDSQRRVITTQASDALSPESRVVALRAGLAELAAAIATEIDAGGS